MVLTEIVDIKSILLYIYLYFNFCLTFHNLEGISMIELLTLAFHIIGGLFGVAFVVITLLSYCIQEARDGDEEETFSDNVLSLISVGGLAGLIYVSHIDWIGWVTWISSFPTQTLVIFGATALFAFPAWATIKWKWILINDRKRAMGKLLESFKKHYNSDRLTPGTTEFTDAFIEHVQKNRPNIGLERDANGEIRFAPPKLRIILMILFAPFSFLLTILFRMRALGGITFDWTVGALMNRISVNSIKNDKMFSDLK